MWLNECQQFIDICYLSSDMTIWKQISKWMEKVSQFDTFTYQWSSNISNFFFLSYCWSIYLFFYHDSYWNIFGWVNLDRFNACLWKHFGRRNMSSVILYYFVKSASYSLNSYNNDNLHFEVGERTKKIGLISFLCCSDLSFIEYCQE